MVVTTISTRNEFSTYSSGFPCFGNFRRPVKRKQKVLWVLYKDKGEVKKILEAASIRNVKYVLIIDLPCYLHASFWFIFRDNEKRERKDDRS
jgi:hypothetical protein